MRPYRDDKHDSWLDRYAPVFGRMTWVLTAVTLVALLGGFHPSDARRDRTILVATVLIVLVNVPSVAMVVKRLRGGEAFGELAGPMLGLVIRLVVAAWVLQFAGTISHEGRSRSPEPRKGAFTRERA
jgi:hypothetical protein